MGDGKNAGLGDGIRAAIAECEASPEARGAGTVGVPAFSGLFVGVLAFSLHRIDSLTPRTPRRRAITPDRNDPCPCGSGKKYKKCHGA